MKCNIRELAQLSDQPCVIEGRLNYKKISNGSYRNQTVFKERWFRLINNYLFYFKISEMGKFDTKCPAGMFVLENSSIQMEHGQSIPFSFSISFIDEPEKRHVFAARAEDNVVQWVMKLRQSSYEYLRNRLHALQSKIFAITGKDPLLLVPRNEGACLWAPSVPFSTAPACTVNTSSFSCHLHTNGAFTLERSKSDVQAHKHFHAEYSQKSTFYTDDHKKVTERREHSSEVYSLERSKTSALLPGSANPIDKTIFDNRPLYSRAAPSPPVRTKLSPSSRRVEMNQDVKVFAEQSRSLGITGILDEAPIPPRRKVSPKNLDIPNPTIEITNNTASTDTDGGSDDLIKF
ncbi:sesquipedalian-1 [Spodoptera frugiperda]|uniref:Pleckstrin homology domain-containing family J member 1 n=1 Tax=Spodoptera frugiperda TaxID=7108 RepID=A0A9R0D6N3_SPOFR|nr:sesquipedalian-1 [Spodoptera frugiperda]